MRGPLLPARAGSESGISPNWRRGEGMRTVNVPRRCRAVAATALFFILTACSSAPATNIETATTEATPLERRTESATQWTERTELFVEWPALVAGEDSRFAIHLTRLDDFAPVTSGSVNVILTYQDGKMETFSTEAPSSPGIFGVTVTPPAAGEVSIEIRLTSLEVSDSHIVSNVPVFASLSQAPMGEAPATMEVISFLKEQQWKMDFATSLAKTGTVRESLLVPAEVSPRSGGEVEVAAPLAGRLLGDNLPVFGDRVQRGQVLASVLPPTSAPSSRAALDLAKAEAEANLEFRRRDRDRASLLVERGAAPLRRLEDAETALTVAEARLTAADAGIARFESTRAGEGDSGAADFSVRAPISGTIQAVYASPGMNLEGGEALFRIVDTDRVYVSAIVPEADFPRVRGLSGAEIEIPGSDQARPAGRLISVGKVVDAETRTFPVVYEFQNNDGSIAINQTVTIRLFLSGTRRGVVIPDTALVDDGGRPIVFVQQGGESFERRPVEVGYEQGGMAEITSGLAEGERIVTKGAYLIRLAALSTQIPAHGHVH